MTVRPGSGSPPVGGRDPSAPPPADPEQVVATVGGRPITNARLDRRIAELRRGPRARHIPPDGVGGAENFRRWILQELVTEAILAHEAQAAGIPVDETETMCPSPDAIARLVGLVTLDVTVTDDELRTYYDRNQDLYERPEARRVRHTVLVDRHLAEAMVRDGDGPGEPTVIRRGQLTGPLEDAIFAADPGTVVGPVRTEHGWHVATIDAVTAASVVPFAEARPSIEAELLGAARARAFDEWLDGRRRALVEIAPDFEHPGHPVNGVPSHRH